MFYITETLYPMLKIQKTQKQAVNQLVVKSNTLNKARYSLTKTEQKLVLILLAMIEKDDGELKTHKISVKTFKEILGIKNDATYAEMRKITKNLMSKVLEIWEDQETVLQTHWFSHSRYYEGKGVVEFAFSEALKPHLLNLKQCFIRYKLGNVLKLNSHYSIRIYELLKQHETMGKRNFSLEELKFMFGVEKEKSYDLFANFKNRIIFPAQKELKEKTDIQFEFIEHKTGRKITDLEFMVRENKQTKTEFTTLEEVKKKINEPSTPPTDLKNSLRDTFNFSDDQIDQLALKHAPEALKNALDVVLYNQQETLTKVKKPKNLFYDCLKNPDKYDLFPVEDKRKQEQKEEEERQAEEKRLKLEEKQQEQEGEKTKIKQQAIDFYIDLNPEEYKQILKEVVAEMKADKTQSFIFTQLQRLAQKEKISIEEALERSLFTKHLGREKLWREKLEGNVMF